MKKGNIAHNKIASALKYTKGDPAPELLASGKGREAERIIAIAHEEGIAVVEDAALAALLDTSAKPGDFIPFWCWEAAAKVLAFVMKTEKIKR
ncbi:MAG: EscU/YscU/HrcU family type III secretion system export apparatus switch protein [Treponema sp.]|nr:EscU/YscU/HrcU family type III secretion system export apparatus switch protein [Treponema sp.]MCL2251706.1 EscU/YscU/HrcU family type III secretion system export apparatus switch protein [Treponema sp.]